MKISAIVLDFDGTIIDTEWPHFEAVRGAYRELGAELTLDQWQHRIGRADNKPWIEDLRELAPSGTDVEELADRWRAHKNAATTTQPIRPGIEELMGRAWMAGLPVAVASSSSHSWVAPHLERLGLADLVHAVRTRDDVEHAKPWPDVYLAACDAMAVDPASAVAIEDSHNGCVAAKAAGLSCVAAYHTVTAGQDFSMADVVVPDLTHLEPGTLGLP
ncbi:MAG: HAD-IA family hydrolase [Acidimicrobiales bacterium]|nr:HAD-IA family hydrolase [Acidimicrobiales bacterium]